MHAPKQRAGVRPLAAAFPVMKEAILPGPPPNPKAAEQSPPSAPNGHWAVRKAWWPIPLLLAAIAGLWVADPQTVYESRALMVLLNLFFTWLASLCICFLTARGFLGSGQPGLLMFGCGSLLWGATSLTAAMFVNRVNTTVTIHNLGLLGAALCHLSGLLWHRRLSRRGRWLAAGYAGALLTGALIFWAAMVGATPLFFVQGHGGTLIREVVLLLTIIMVAWVAWQMIQRAVPQFSAFYYWYGLGLGLVATGLIGVFLLSVQGGILGWTSRLTQYLGSAYLLAAAVAAARETGTWKLSLSAVEEAWLKKELLPAFQNKQHLRLVLRYGSAVAGVAVALGLHLVVTARIGPSLPPYLLFATTAMIVVPFAGFGPGVLYVLSTDLVVAYWILPPVGQFHIASPADRLGLIIHTGAGLFFCVVVELARRIREKAAAFDREAAVRESRERLAAFAEAAFEGIIESEAGRIVDCNEQFARMAGYSVADLRGKEIAGLIAPEDRERVMADVKQGRGLVSEHAMLRKDGTRIVVETRGRPVSPGSARRHTAIRDLTERKQVEAAAARYDLLSRHARDPMLLMELSGKIVEANQAAVDFYGYPREALLRLNIKNMRRGDNAETVDFQMKHAAAGGIVFEAVHTCRDGKPVPVEVSSRGVTIEGRPMLLSVVRDITQRKITEEALRASEERFRMLVEQAVDGIFVSDASGRYTDVNTAGCQMLGYSREEILRRSIADVIAKHEISRISSQIARFDGGQVVASEWRFRRKNGSFFTGEVVGRKLPDGRMQGILRDITERKRAEDALRRSEALYRAIGESIDYGVWVCDANGRNTYASESFLKLVGITQEQCSDFGWSNVLHPDDAERTIAAWKECSRTGGIWDIEHRFRGVDGEYHPVLARGVPIKNEYGQIVSWAGINLDISRIKQAEAALRESEARIQQALRSSRSFTFEWLPPTDRVLRSASCETILKIAGNEVCNDTGQHFFERIHPDDRARFTQTLHDLTADASTYNTEYRVLCGDGSVAVLEETGQATFDAAGKLQRLVGVSTDITERKRAEQALKEAQAQLADHAENLEKTVARRTAELRKQTAERERLQRELLTISEREKLVISQELHDGLCQNLAGTAMMVSILARSLAARADNDAESAKQICTLLNSSVHEARNLSHGLHPVGPEGEGLMNALTELAGTVNNLFHIRCTFRCLRPVFLENGTASTHLFRIAQEAINNARKHGEADEVRITLAKTAKAIVLTIRDNGVGIPSDLSRKRGMGLKSMGYRATEIGATLSVRRGSEKGTVVRCIVPTCENDRSS